MNILRRITLSLMAGLLSFTLFGVAWSNVALETVHNRDVVKKWFDSSGFYERVIDITLDELNKSPNKSELGDNNIPISDPNIQAVVREALNPQLLKTNVEKLLDSTYDWLDSRSEKLDFAIDLTSVKPQLATGLGDYAKTRADGLPPCGSGESFDSFDAFNSTCLPKGVSADQVKQKVSEEILNNPDLLKDPIITASDIKVKDDNGQEVPLGLSEQAQAIQKGYELSSTIMYIFSGLALIAALAIIFISSDHLKGIRRVGYVFLGSGTVLFVTYLAMGVASGWADDQLLSSPDKSVAQKELGASILKVVFTDIRAVLLKYVVCFLVLGLLAVLARTLLHRRNHHAAIAKGEKSPDDPIHLESEPVLTTKPETKTESASNKILDIKDTSKKISVK